MPTGNITMTILIDGMTCISCENRIERKLSGTEGIVSAEVSFAKGNAVITYNPDVISQANIEEIIEKLDYHVKKPSEEKKKKFNITQTIGIVIIIFSLFMLIRRFGGLQIINKFPVAKEGMGYGMLLLIGLLTSVHCIAMCGGICLSQCVPKKPGGEEAGSRFASFRPSLLYNLGRVISYTVIGAIVGALGSVISFSGSLRGIVQIVAGVFMVIMGLNMLNIFPWLRRFNLRMPKIFAKKINAQKKSNSPLYVGLLNGLMPCGPLQAMQIYALSTGSPIKGALSMFIFSIGTVPLMLTFGAISSLLSKKFTKKVMTVGAVMVVILGIFMFSNGASLSGIAVPSIGSTKAAAATKNVAVIAGGVQTVTTTLSSGGYESITVQKGIPVKWTVKADKGTINGCNNSMVIPKFNVTHDFVPGDNVIEFTPDESGTFPYSCWMGMIRSKIYVVDDINNIKSSDISDNNVDNTGIPNCCSGGAGAGQGAGGSSAQGSYQGAGKIADYTIPTDKIAVAKVVNGEQTVDINVGDTRFTPAVIVVQKGIQTTWTINANKLNDSNSKLIFPAYNTQLTTKTGQNNIYFVPAADFDFSSSDFKFFGYVKVVDDINKVDLSAIKKEVKAYVPTY